MSFIIDAGNKPYLFPDHVGHVIYTLRYFLMLGPPLEGYPDTQRGHGSPEHGVTQHG